MQKILFSRVKIEENWCLPMSDNRGFGCFFCCFSKVMHHVASAVGINISIHILAADNTSKNVCVQM